MPVIEKHNVISGLTVSAAMRRQVISLDRHSPIAQGIRMMIRHRISAVLLTHEGIPEGVVSTTDLIGAYFAGLPTDMALENIMGGQPTACFPDDSLEDVLEIMEAAGVHRLYVTGSDRAKVIGIVSFADIVGLFYRYCRACDKGYHKKRNRLGKDDAASRFRVKDVMTADVLTCQAKDPVLSVIEILSAAGMSAALIKDEDSIPCGVVSKTDLIMAYHRGTPLDEPAESVMSSPVVTVADTAFLVEALQTMLIKDVQRVFVFLETSGPKDIKGVLALSDAARFRSGSCRACTTGRILSP